MTKTIEEPNQISMSVSNSHPLVVAVVSISSYHAVEYAYCLRNMLWDDGIKATVLHQNFVFDWVTNQEDNPMYRWLLTFVNRLTDIYFRQKRNMLGDVVIFTDWFYTDHNYMRELGWELSMGFISNLLPFQPDLVIWLPYRGTREELFTLNTELVEMDAFGLCPCQVEKRYYTYFAENPAIPYFPETAISKVYKELRRLLVKNDEEPEMD